MSEWRNPRRREQSDIEIETRRICIPLAKGQRALFEVPESGKIETGYGVESFDVFMTWETRVQIEVSGHGKIRVVPQSTLDTILGISLLNLEKRYV